MNIIEEKDDLWNALLGGDRKALEEIYVTYAPELINYGYRITSNKEVIKDCVQDLFVGIWNSREKLVPTTSIRFYLFRALRNRMLRYLEREEGRLTSLDDSAYDKGYMLNDDEEEYYRVSKFEISLPQAIAHLPERQREIIQLRFYHDFEIEEITEIMSISNQSVRNTLYKAIFKLRDVLSSKSNNLEI